MLTPSFNALLILWSITRQQYFCFCVLQYVLQGSIVECWNRTHDLNILETLSRSKEVTNLMLYLVVFSGMFEMYLSTCTFLWSAIPAREGTGTFGSKRGGARWVRFSISFNRLSKECSYMGSWRKLDFKLWSYNRHEIERPLRDW